MRVLVLIFVIACFVIVFLGEYQQQTSKFQSKTKILLLIKLPNFSQNLSTANFCSFSTLSKFHNFYDKPNKCDNKPNKCDKFSFLVKSDLLEKTKAKFYWNLNKIDIILSISSSYCVYHHLRLISHLLH